MLEIQQQAIRALVEILEIVLPLLSFVILTKKVNLSREVKKGFPEYRWTFILEVMVAIIRVLRRGVTLPSLLYKVNLELAAVAKN